MLEKMTLEASGNDKNTLLCQEKLTQLQNLAIWMGKWTKNRVVSEKSDTTPKLGHLNGEMDKKSSCVREKLTQLQKLTHRIDFVCLSCIFCTCSTPLAQNIDLYTFLCVQVDFLLTSPLCNKSFTGVATI